MNYVSTDCELSSSRTKSKININMRRLSVSVTSEQNMRSVGTQISTEH